MLLSALHASISRALSKAAGCESRCTTATPIPSAWRQPRGVECASIQVRRRRSRGVEGRFQWLCACLTRAANSARIEVPSMRSSESRCLRCALRVVFRIGRKARLGSTEGTPVLFNRGRRVASSSAPVSPAPPTSASCSDESLAPRPAASARREVAATGNVPAAAQLSVPEDGEVATEHSG